MILPRNGAPMAAPSHAKTGRVLQPGFGKHSADPMLEDCLLGATALCAELATDDLATLARAGDISASWASDLRRTGGRGSFLHRTTVLTYRLAQRGSARAWSLVAHLKTTAKQALMPTTDADLIERFWDLMDLESEAEGRENLATARLAKTRDLEELKRTTLAEAAVAEELAAVIQEMQRRRIDPFAEARN